MNGQSAVQNNGAGNGHAPIMVVVPSNGAFRVYPAANPAAVAFVGGTAENPTCTCAEFRSDAHEWGRCAHVAAVFGQSMNGKAHHDPAAQNVPPNPAAVTNGNGHPENPVQLVLKRSASPDGRIDSLSVEIHQRVELGQNGTSIMQEAVNTLALEDQIIGFFRQQSRPQGSGNGYAGNGQASAAQGNGYAPDNGAVPAELTHIGGTQTKRGYSLYINVRVSGQDVRMFGPADKLAGYIADAGYQSNTFHIAKDTQLRLPCQVVLDRKTNSKYPVIERVLPQGTMAGTGRGQ